MVRSALVRNIDEGLLNTEQASALRGYIMEHMILKGIVRLPDVTFKPNKINVKSSVLHMVKRETPVPDMDDEYPVYFLDMRTLGYQGSGEVIRNLDFKSVVDNLSSEYHGEARRHIGVSAESTHWRWFTRSSHDIAADPTKRFDLKYWDPVIVDRIKILADEDAKTISELNITKTKRGKSPPSGLYVDEDDGYALVIKAGTNINKQGGIAFEGDYIEKNVYDDMSTVCVQDGDVLLSSTGDGTLGKCAVYRGDKPAIFDGHVTLIRLDQVKVHPEYLCDYLRLGFGAAQIARFFTGSTGLIELPPDLVDRILVKIPDLETQKSLSSALRAAEASYSASVSAAQLLLQAATEAFRVD